MRPADARSAASVSSFPSSGLQGLVTSPSRKFALINGAIVPVGGVVREGRLVDVTGSAALLNKDGENEVLQMYPRIDKKQIRGAPADKEQMRQ
jgi:hypothetical protein